jgi:hypothetical protein
MMEEMVRRRVDDRRSLGSVERPARLAASGLFFRGG